MKSYIITGLDVNTAVHDLYNKKITLEELFDAYSEFINEDIAKQLIAAKLNISSDEDTFSIQWEFSKSIYYMLRNNFPSYMEIYDIMVRVEEFTTEMSDYWM